ncbi:23S rRNA (guanosine(2251)-2'-O)-methyltransferase RlmB [Marinoscillum furvescens]|uniref:23S rRNA (Guanosine2251-2'-O)-methyltransferase n=1 Tax=Marinoscillum furvescens DSM 4134 TaxID=1122208 RepID=A0A3D9L363_MARFU|nr:23S rRNA (guanosine(2251)-2'-O)-methyltransferase RlmB [Marinoscillum furvescens]RED99724.1 23S rRNA (guanosine2251-2'-O)-methyltransferase [Marinoscillum furvescens DSM 4134]
MAIKKFDNMIYGIRAVIETIQSGKDLEKLFVQKGLKGDLMKELLTLAHQRKVPISSVPVEKINRFTRKNHQGAVAFVSPVQYHQIDHVLPGIFEDRKVPIILVLDRVTDVRNFGGIARTAECMGADAILIPTKGSAQINADAVKTSAGALNFIPVCREPNLKEAIQFLKDSGLQVIAATEKAEYYFQDLDLMVPTAIVMGSEDEGISPAYLALADKEAKIPLSGEIESLNVSAAAAMALYEVQRQRLI